MQKGWIDFHTFIYIIYYQSDINHFTITSLLRAECSDEPDAALLRAKRDTSPQTMFLHQYPHFFLARPRWDWMSWTTWPDNSPQQAPPADGSRSLRPHRPGCHCGLPTSPELPPNKNCWFNFLLQLCKELCSNHMQVKNSTETVPTGEAEEWTRKKNKTMKSWQPVCGQCGVQASTMMLLLLHCIAKIKENLTCQRCTKFWCYPNVISFKFKCYLPKYSSNRLLKSAVVQAEHVLAAVMGGAALLLVPVFNLKNLCSDSSWDETKESNVCLFHFLASLLTLQSTLSW